jgi:hypothetical protein
MRPTLHKRKKPKLVVGKREKAPYNRGGRGFARWCEDFIWIEIYINGLATWCPIANLPTEVNPETGRCSRDMWDFQKEIAKEALRMRGSRFIHRLIVFCWMRGEGKSLFVCLIQLWKFFNFPAQKIMLGANSRDQVKFVHFDIMRDIILNSPKLLAIVGRKNVQEKEIRLKNKKGDVVSFIRSISSFSGIVSNITGYTFSEIFDMKNPKFFTQLDGSIRNVPNALGVIDSTVSSKDHILYGLFDAYRKNLDKTLYFSHRESPKANYKDFTNPEMTQAQLDSYKAKFPPREYAMYFRNTWDAGARKMFPEYIIQAGHYLGYLGSLGETNKVLSIMEAYEDYYEAEKGVIDQHHPMVKALDTLIPIEQIYKLETTYKQPRAIRMNELEKLSHMYDTNWALCVGVDRADPMKADITRGARTIVSLVAKGLPGSMSNPAIALQEESAVARYVYFLLDLRHVQMSDIDTIKSVVEKYSDDYDGVEVLCTEKWGMWDIGDWCEDNDIEFQPISPSYTIQMDGFSEFYNLLMTGRFKFPKIAVPGSRSEDLFVEELRIFDHDPVSKFYGSPEKKDKQGIQDDAVYSVNYAIYGGRFLTIDDFRLRTAKSSFGEYHEDKSSLVGDYA